MSLHPITEGGVEKTVALLDKHLPEFVGMGAGFAVIEMLVPLAIAFNPGADVDAERAKLAEIKTILNDLHDATADAIRQLRELMK